MTSERILDGIAILDLSARLPGQFAARALAEAGADVLKVEPPGGDPLRMAAPTSFASWNRSKRSVEIDLGDAEGRAQLNRLMARADMLLHDLSPVEQDRLDMTDEGLARRFPKLIVGAVGSYPDGHSLAATEPVELLVQAASGLMDEQQGNRPGPIYTRMPYASWCAGFLLLAGVLARLVQRERAGMVGSVRTSLFQGALVPTALFWQRSERLPDVLEEPHTLPKVWPGASLSLFECADGVWIQLAGSLGGWVESPPVLETLAVLDKVELSDHGVTQLNRKQWQQIFLTRDSQSWCDAFGAVDVPCTLVRDLGESFADEQSLVNGYAVEVDDRVIGPALQAGPPVTLTPPCAVVSPAPPVGDLDLAGALEWFGHDEPAPDSVRATPTSALPLAGLRALEFGSMIAAPFGAQCLADFGAEVVKVEPRTGDRGRGLTQFAGANRRKRSLAIDLKNPDAAEPLRRLIASSDIVIHNVRAGAARRLGIDLDGLRGVNPDIVYSHVSANGLQGPMSGYPGYDPTAQAMTGWERANVGPGQPPMWMRNSVLDVSTGLMSFAGALLALLHRERTGRPGDCATSLLALGTTIASETALRLPDHDPLPVPQIDPLQTGLSAEHCIYELADGWLAVAADTVAAREALHAVAGTSPDLEEAFRERHLDECLAALAAHEVPAVPVRLDQMDAFFDDQQSMRFGLCRRFRTAGYGQIDVVSGFWQLACADAGVDGIPPLGADTSAVLTELGFSAGEIDELAQAGVLNGATNEVAR